MPRALAARRAVAQNVGANLVIGRARQRSYPGNVFHRSVTAQLLDHYPVLALPADDQAWYFSCESSA